jgi:colanic acid biosynthesis glycosyl transferase WcaI
MRILLIGLNFAPELTGVGRYTGDMAAWLARRGHDVSVVTTRPYYPEWRRSAGIGRFGWSVEWWQGCRIIRCPLYVPRRMSGARRVVHLASFALASIPAAVARLPRGKIDVVSAIVPTLLSAPLALAVARLSGAKAWMHVQDLEIDAAAELGMIKSPTLIDRALGAERRLIERFDLVSTISPRMLEAVERKGVDRDRLMLFPNWVDTSRVFPMAPSRALRRELGLPESDGVVLYSGSMGHKQGLETVVAAARLLAADATRSPLFVLAGAGPARSELQRQAADLPNVRFLPLQPEERFNEFLNLGDIHVLPQRRDAADLVMPSKLGAILAAGKPIIAMTPADSQIARSLDGAGVVVPPEDAASLAAAVRDLAADALRRDALAAAARRVARDQFEGRTILARMEERLASLISPPPSHIEATETLDTAKT